MGFLLSFLATAASLGAAVWIVGGLEFTGSWWEFVILAAIFGLANAIVKPIIKFFSIPLIILTMGLFLLIVNALVFQLVIWLAGPSVWDLGLTSTGFFWATFLGAIVISIVGWIIGIILPEAD
ncbi:MAG: phage holin family protein [Acidimicrobiia bacterium]